MTQPLFDLSALATTSKGTLPSPPRIPTSAIVAKVVIPGTPMSKQRPRFVRKSGTVFTPRETRERERTIGQYVLVAGWRRPPDAEQAFGIRAAFYVSDQQRKDTDNMLKLVLDGLNMVVWADDSQVFEVMGWKREDAANPRTEIVIYTLGFSATSHLTCARCSKRYRVYPSWTDRKYCSRKCSNLAAMTGVGAKCSHCGELVYRKAYINEASKTGKFYCDKKCKSLAGRTELTCAKCHELFTSPTSWPRKYCSDDCQRAVARERVRGNRTRYGPCEVCGGPVSRKEYKHCGGCQEFRGRWSTPKSVATLEPV